MGFLSIVVRHKRSRMGAVEGDGTGDRKPAELDGYTYDGNECISGMRAMLPVSIVGKDLRGF